MKGPSCGPVPRRAGRRGPKRHTWLWNEDGRDRKGQQVDSGEFEFVLGVTQTLRAFEEGLVGMRVGGLRRMQVPPDYALGLLEVRE